MTPTRALIEAAEALLKVRTPEREYILQEAISSAKAGEEDVEIMYRVDIADRLGWVMGPYDRFHETDVAAYARADSAFGSAEKIKAVRVVRVETKETVISVMEKEGL